MMRAIGPSDGGHGLAVRLAQDNLAEMADGHWAV
jgi:hypothetical protein